MRFRFGMMLGFGAGYLMGAKAGRYRYDQIMRSVGKFWESEKAQELRETAKDMVEQIQEQASGTKEYSKTIKLDAELSDRVEPYVRAAAIGFRAPNTPQSPKL